VLQVSADFVIDCTGLEADIAEHRVLADLLAHTGAGRNPLGRLDVERTFELRGAASDPGVIYASGATTLGGYFPGVDTFSGSRSRPRKLPTTSPGAVSAVGWGRSAPPSNGCDGCGTGSLNSGRYSGPAGDRRLPGRLEAALLNDANS